jgi:hypothetical protein
MESRFFVPIVIYLNAHLLDQGANEMRARSSILKIMADIDNRESSMPNAVV